MGYRRRLVVAVTAASLLLPGALPAPALAAGPAPAVAASAAAQNKVTLEQAIRIAKEAFPEVAGFKQFTSNYTEYNGRAAWQLGWSNGDEPGGNCHIAVSAVTGEIVNLDLWLPSPSGRYQGFPAYTRAQAQALAEKEARRIVPDKFAQCVPAPEEIPEPIIFPLRDRDYPVTYHFNFVRTVHGIPVTGDGVRVTINAENGKLQQFYVSWQDNLSLPDPSGRIGPDRAAAVFAEDGLELAYNYFGPRDRDTGVRPKLVYQVKNGRFILDALTGKVRDPREDDYFFDVGDGLGGGGGEPMYSRAKKEEPLSPPEQEAVDKLAGYLSPDQAQARAEKACPPPAGLQLTGKNLSSRWDVPGGKTWDFNYNDQEKRRYFSIRVDAATGELLGFSRNDNLDPQDYLKPPVVKFTKEQAEKIAADFFKKQQPARAGQVTLRYADREMGPWAKRGDDRPRAWRFEFARLVNGVVYPDNGFNVTVSTETGEITNYDMRWWETDFPQPAGLIDKAKAAALFLEKHPLSLDYSRAYAKWPTGPDTPQYFLLYHLTKWPMGVLDAATGQELDGAGKPIVSRQAAFKDIAGHPAEKDIQTLADQGIITAGDDGRFRPNDRVTGGELLAWLVASANRDGYRPPAKEDDKQLIERARALGIIAAGEDIRAASPVTRLQAARWLVNSQGFGPLARHAEIFDLKALKVSDAAAVSQADRGYVAAALAMGYLTPQAGGRFGPEGTVNRSEAASMLVRALTAK